ncbi:MAG: tetratricopeptide repeat protein [Reyranellaceae bacterium]
MVRWSVLLALALGSLPIVASAQNDSRFAASYKLETEKRYDAAAAEIAALAESGNELARLRLGWLAYLAGRYNDSINHYNIALQLNPNAIDARLGITLPLLAQQRWQDAAGQARQVLQLSPWDYTAHVRLMVAEEGLKQWTTLESHARELARIYPADATALVYLARARAWQRNTVGARQAYAQVLERFPGNEEARSFLKVNS